jgi:hypothetical protein
VDSKVPGLLDDLWVIEEYVTVFGSYQRLWADLTNQKYSSSWNELQNVLSGLRWIKKFSGIDIGALERQLVGLESIYPYRIFFSAGMVVDYFICSICGNDSNSDDCLHIAGELYDGVMAVASANRIIDIDHLSVVKYPDDKRCVVQYPDKSDHFRNVDNLVSFIRSKEKRVSEFSGVNSIDIKVSNKDYKKLERNEKCFCGSGKKFKKCCISKNVVDGKYFQFIFDGELFGIVA